MLGLCRRRTLAALAMALVERGGASEEAVGRASMAAALGNDSGIAAPTTAKG